MTHDIFQEETSTFGFPIKEIDEDTWMKNIHHSRLIKFHGLYKEYHDTFMFTLTYFAEATTM
jgi:hypothetical protein